MFDLFEYCIQNNVSVEFRPYEDADRGVDAVAIIVRGSSGDQVYQYSTLISLVMFENAFSLQSADAKENFIKETVDNLTRTLKCSIEKEKENDQN